MPKRSSKTNGSDGGGAQNAKSGTDAHTPNDSDEKNQAAVELGRLGGQKGGPARARKLSTARRSEIARKAAQARWKAKRKSQ